MAQQPAGPPGRPMPRQPDASHRQATNAGGVLGLLPDPSRRTKSGSTGRRLIADSFASGSAATGPAMDQADSRSMQWPLSAQVEAQVQAKRESAAVAAAQGRGGSKTAIGRSRPRKLDDEPAALARRESKSGAGVTRAGSVSFTAAAAPSDARRAQTAAEQRVREDMLKVRDEYFATLQESAGRVELAMAAIDRYSAAEVRREEQEEDEDEDEDEESGSGDEEEEEGKYPMEGTVRLTARGRSERLMKRLQTEEAVAQLAEVAHPSHATAPHMLHHLTMLHPLIMPRPSYHMARLGEVTAATTPTTTTTPTAPSTPTTAPTAQLARPALPPLPPLR